MVTDNTNTNFEKLSFEEIMDEIASTIGNSKVELGLRLLTKYDVLHDANSEENVFDLYYKMAETNFPGAMFQLGECYAKGTGGAQQDIDEAFYWYQKAAKLNNRDAQRTVATMYKCGVAVLKNTRIFVEWITKAAEKDDLLAMLKLADYYWDCCYSNPQLKDKAYCLYAEVVCKIYEQGLTKESRVVRHIIDQANNENKIAQYGMEIMYKYGIIFPQDDEKEAELYMYTPFYEKTIRWENENNKESGNNFALKRCIIAAKDGIPRGQINLGNCYTFGLYGAPRDYGKALECYRKVLEEHDELDELIYEELMDALVYLAEGYTEGSENVPQDYEKAAECLTIAAEKNWPEAQYLLGDCYAEGLGVEQDNKKAVELYTKAAERGYEDAQWKLCYSYLEGEYGLDVSYDDAYVWCAKMCDNDALYIGQGTNYEDLKEWDKMGFIGGTEFRYQVLGFLHHWHQLKSNK